MVEWRHVQQGKKAWSEATFLFTELLAEKRKPVWKAVVKHRLARKTEQIGDFETAAEARQALEQYVQDNRTGLPKAPHYRRTK